MDLKVATSVLKYSNVDHSRMFHPGVCDCDPVSCRETESRESAEIGSAARFTCSAAKRTKFYEIRGEPAKSLRPALSPTGNRKR